MRHPNRHAPNVHANAQDGWIWTSISRIPYRWSLVWRVPVAGCLVAVVAIIYLIDDAARQLRKLHRGDRNG